MESYNYSGKSIKTYLHHIYDIGLQKSSHLSDTEVEEIITNIGIFKFKGYYFAFKENITSHSIDDVLMVYFFDKYLTRIIMELTSSVETKLKTILVELCYKQIKDLPSEHLQKNNPFFYLIKSNYHDSRVKLNYPSVQSWKESLSQLSSESYMHYNIYYKHTYRFTENRNKFLGSIEDDNMMNLIEEINYPPFHYLVEGATLGTLIYLIKKMKLFGSYDVLIKVAGKFGVRNTQVNFLPYLERLNEVRNRAAHRERIFNRSYRSISRVAHFSHISRGISQHKFIDVHMFLFFMLGKLECYHDRELFIKEEIERLFVDFKRDYYIGRDSHMLIDKITEEKFKDIKEFIIRGMG